MNLPGLKEQLDGMPDAQAFLMALGRTVGRFCGDPRDRIYLCLSFVSQGQHYRGDYRKSLEQEFWDAFESFAKYLMREKLGRADQLEDLAKALMTILGPAPSCIHLDDFWSLRDRAGSLHALDKPIYQACRTLPLFNLLKHHRNLARAD